jgi:hypothetical protein
MSGLDITVAILTTPRREAQLAGYRKWWTTMLECILANWNGIPAFSVRIGLPDDDAKSASANVARAHNRGADRPQGRPLTIRCT